MQRIPLRSIAGLLILAATAIPAKVLHFDPNYSGADADGSTGRPYATLDKCFTTALAGDKCLLEPGSYNLATPTGASIGRVTTSGTPESPIVVESRLPGTVFIGAWQELLWSQSGTNLWTGTLKTPLSASIEALQGVWAGRQNMSGVRLWNQARHNAVQAATWPHSDGPFPRTAYLGSGSTNAGYNLAGLPAGTLAGAKVHVFRDEEQGAIVRSVIAKTSATTLTINTAGYDDLIGSYNNHNRVWLSDHPDLLTSTDLGRWTWDPAAKNVRLASATDPGNAYTLQVSTIGPDLSNASFWTFRNLDFVGIVPITSASTFGLDFDGVNFNKPGLNDGTPDFDGNLATLTGFVLSGYAHTVERSQFTGCPMNCLEILGPGVTVKNNVVSGSQLNAGAYAGAIHVLGRNAQIRHNLVTDAGGSGIVINRDALNAVVSRNRIENWGILVASRVGGIAAMFKTTSLVEIDSNLIINQAIQDLPQTDPRPGAAINLLFGRNLAFIHHNILDNATIGLRMGGWDMAGHEADNNSFDNTIISNSFGPHLGFSWLTVVLAGTPYKGTRFANNIYRVPGGLLLGYNGSDVYPNSPNDGILGGTYDHNLLPAQNPLFINPNASDWNFGLSTGSPAIDAGVSYTLPNGSGPIVYKGASPDVGAVEYSTNWTVGPEASDPTLPSSPFSLDDPSKWVIPADQPVAASSNKTEGAAAFAVTPTGYKVLESPTVSQTAIGGLGFIALDAFIPSQQANPYWVGAVQIYVECPSRGLWNQWVGQWELTGRPQDQWQTLQLPVPSFISQQLTGATYSDLKVRIAVNLNPGSGVLGLDNLRFNP